MYNFEVRLCRFHPVTYSWRQYWCVKYFMYSFWAQHRAGFVTKEVLGKCFISGHVLIEATFTCGTVPRIFIHGESIHNWIIKSKTIRFKVLFWLTNSWLHNHRSMIYDLQARSGKHLVFSKGSSLVASAGIDSLLRMFKVIWARTLVTEQLISLKRVPLLIRLNWGTCSRLSTTVASLDFWGFLAHLVMSLCNHALSVVCRCHCHQCQCCHWHWHLCTALPVTGLIIEASYLTNICSYAPSIYTWNIKSMWHIFFKWQPF